MMLGVKHRNGSGPAAVIYLLEELSKVFIPWMEKVAKDLNPTANLTYTKKHGEADAKHSTLALDAFWAEYALWEEQPHAHERPKAAIQNVNELLGLIFSPIHYF